MSNMPRVQYAIFPDNTPVITEMFALFGAQFVSFGGHEYCLPVSEYYAILAQVEDAVFDSPELDDDAALDQFQDSLSFLYWSNEVLYH